MADSKISRCAGKSGTNSGQWRARERRTGRLITMHHNITDGHRHQLRIHREFF
jgi:hypothetical protein